VAFRRDVHAIRADHSGRHRSQIPPGLVQGRLVEVQHGPAEETLGLDRQKPRRRFFQLDEDRRGRRSATGEVESRSID
jgi:hypothetical protein